MRLSQFMAECLWHKQHGYYATRLPIGAGGDFITAPEISQTFGELLGLWTAVVWRDAMAAPAAFTLAELGPGRGTLMRDALRATRAVPGFHAGLRCHLVEASSPLVELQRLALADCGVPLAWSDTVNGLRGPVVILANEFFDALPIEQWVKATGGWLPRSVELGDQGQLVFGVSADGLPRGDLDFLFPDAPLGTVFESRDAGAILRQLPAGQPLVMLIIDYGHEQTAIGDSLQAVRQHRFEHPLTSPGEADLSAHVGFAELADVARACGLAVDGPLPQAEFLGRLGIVERASKLMAANPAKALEIEGGVARLLAPLGMGGRFKVMALRSAGLPVLPGFAAAA